MSGYDILRQTDRKDGSGDVTKVQEEVLKEAGRAVMEAVGGSNFTPIGEWRYGDANRSALIDVTTDNRNSLVLLLSMFRNGDLSYKPFTSRDTSELNTFENLGTNVFFSRNYATLDGQVADLLDSLRSDLETVDKYAASWEDDLTP
jgi:hypothetical protein